MARKWQKTAIFSCNFDLFLAFFIDCDHIYVPKGTNWGSTSRPHIGDLVMSLFFTLGSTVHDWGWPKNGPFWTKNGQTWQACQRSKRDQNGQPMCFWPFRTLFGPLWTLLDHFRRKWWWSFMKIVWLWCHLHIVWYFFQWGFFSVFFLITFSAPAL